MTTHLNTRKVPIDHGQRKIIADVEAQITYFQNNIDAAERLRLSTADVGKLDALQAQRRASVVRLQGELDRMTQGENT